MNLCIDCKWHTIMNYQATITEVARPTDFCKSPNLTSPVNGKVVNEMCAKMRHHNSSQCGMNGAWFERKDLSISIPPMPTVEQR